MVPDGGSGMDLMDALSALVSCDSASSQAELIDETEHAVHKKKKAPRIPSERKVSLSESLNKWSSRVHRLGHGAFKRRRNKGEPWE